MASSAVCFGGCWAGLAAERVLNAGSQIWTALVLSLLVMTVLGFWAERARENRAGDAPTEFASAEVKEAGEGAPLPGAGLPANLRATQGAIALLERTLADRERLLGGDHLDTLTSRNNLAKAYLTAGRPAEAIPLLERTLADRGRVLGADHANTLMSRNILASAYLAAGRPAQALPLFERMVADSERLHGGGHLSTNILRMNLAALRAKMDGSGVSPGEITR
jgi:hypothetical protein